MTGQAMSTPTVDEVSTRQEPDGWPALPGDGQGATSEGGELQERLRGRDQLGAQLNVAPPRVAVLSDQGWDGRPWKAPDADGLAAEAVNEAPLPPAPRGPGHVPSTSAKTGLSDPESPTAAEPTIRKYPHPARPASPRGAATAAAIAADYVTRRALRVGDSRSFFAGRTGRDVEDPTSDDDEDVESGLAADGNNGNDPARVATWSGAHLGTPPGPGEREPAEVAPSQLPSRPPAPSGSAAPPSVPTWPLERSEPGRPPTPAPPPEAVSVAQAADQRMDLLAWGTPRADGAGGRPGALTSALVSLARRTWPAIDRGLLDDVVAAGETAHVRARADPRHPVSAAAAAAAAECTEDATGAALAVARHGEQHAPGRASWAQGGTVIPVLGASAGVGASVVAAALFDALDACGVPTLLVDAADPARSGLASAVRHQGAPARTLHPKVAIAYARRGDGWVAQLTAPPTEVLSTRMVPSPSWWLPDETPPGATVVDLGWDPWALAAAPLRGAGAWLEAGFPRPRPVLVVEATRPSLLKANQLLTRLRPWITTGQVAAPAALIVTGAKRWPRGISGVATRSLGELLEHAVFLPYDAATAAEGIGPDSVADRLRVAASRVPARWGLIPDTAIGGRSRTRSVLRGR